VIDHSVQIDVFASADALQKTSISNSNARGALQVPPLGQDAFEQFPLGAPGTGLCHQVNLEYPRPVRLDLHHLGNHLRLPGHAVWHRQPHHDGERPGHPRWGVGGIEAEAAMLGQPIAMLIPDVIGFRLTGKTKEGITATDVC